MFQVAAQVRQISISRSPKNLTGEGDVPKLKEKLPLLSIPNDGNQYRSVVSVERSDFQQHVMDSSRSFMQDVIDTFHLAVPLFISRVSSVGVSSTFCLCCKSMPILTFILNSQMQTTDTALLGHVSGQALSAAALSDLFRMCTGALLQGRVAGILVGQTIG